MNFPSGLTAQPLKLERRGNAGDSAADHQDVGRVGSAMTQAGSPDPRNDRLCITSSCPRQFWKLFGSLFG